MGSRADINATAGPAMQRVDLAGRSLLPGFIDAHQHFAGVGGSQEAIDCKAPGMDSTAAATIATRTG